MWNWHAGKVALEWLFFTGEVTATHRTTGFEKVYDLTERVLPAAVLRAPDARPGRRRPGAGPHRGPGARGRHRAGPARLLPAPARGGPRPRSPSSPTPGSCCPVEVRRLGRPGVARPGGAGRPRWIRARALLSPFDSLVWERPRVERIFGFRYRLEIYTPAAKRVHGYYVLPFLLGDQLVARVDLKADRQAGVLRVQAAHAEEGVDRPLVAAALADELRLMADWLELDDVAVADRGDLAPGPRAGRCAGPAPGVRPATGRRTTASPAARRASAGPAPRRRPGAPPSAAPRPRRRRRRRSRAPGTKSGTRSIGESR